MRGVTMTERGLGAVLPKRWPTREELAAHRVRMGLAAAAGPVAPTTLGTPDVRDQGSTQSCFGFATAQAVHIRRQALGLASSLPSPMVQYFEARRLEVARDEDVEDTGSDPYGMMTALDDFGVCPWDAAPFDEARINARPSQSAMLQAQRVQCELRPILETGDQLWDAIRHAVAAERLPVLIALEVTPAFEHPTNGVVDNPDGDSRGLHANCIFGVNEDGALDCNSWGTSYGHNGVALLTPRFLGARIAWSATLDLEVQS